MTGIRLWTAEVTAFGVVVRIEQDLTFLFVVDRDALSRTDFPVLVVDLLESRFNSHGIFQQLTRQCSEGHFFRFVAHTSPISVASPS